MRRMVFLVVAALAAGAASAFPEVKAEGWIESRQALKRVFMEREYGVRPVERPADLRFETSPDAEILGGKAVRREVRLTMTGPRGPFSFTAVAYLPKGAKKVASFVYVYLYRTATVVEAFDRRAEDPSTRSFPVADIIRRGYAAVAFVNAEVALDWREKCFSSGVFAAWGPGPEPSDRKGSDWGAISAWAWGASRVLDWIETQPDFDAKRVAVIGHSRGGKTALWAGVTDERFALACVNESGCSGAKLNHMDLPKSEPIATIVKNFPHWFCPDYFAYAGKEMEMDFDQHQLVALMAPRAVAVADATLDDWAGPAGEFRSCELASPAWAAFGKKGLVAPEGMPKADTAIQDGWISYHLRMGKHELTPFDWQRYMDFADRRLASAGAADLTFENEAFRLVVGEDAVAKSLVVKATGEECLKVDPTVPLFSVTQVHPYNNEVKLVWPNKRTVYPANRIRREGDRLIVGFEIAPYEAVIEVKAAKDYIAFRLADFIVHPEDYGRQKQRKPPVQELRILQLPVRDRANYGCWFGVSWDERAAVGIVGANHYAQVDQERRDGYRVFSAWAQYGVKLRGVEAALVAAPGKERFLDAVDAIERDYGLPRGVASRRSGVTNASIYWVRDLDRDNVDEHVRYAKEGGFRRMLVYYQAMCKDGTSYYRGLGDYDWRDSYPNKEADMREVLRRVKAAGITPGLHVLQTHIGLESRYVTPEADPRLGIVRKFTLAAPIEGDEIRVLESTDDVVEEPLCRVLKFGTELIGFRDVRDGVFTGLERGKFGTTVKGHARGEIGGLLDVCEFSAHSCYIDQKTDLQDEIAGKIKKIYDCGFEFLYFDGSEGTGEPYAFEVPYGQYRVWRVLGKEPLFGSGAAKSHFGWHMLAGGNAFDIFKPEIFKAMIRKYPLAEAPIIAQDFTQVNFGWWMFWKPSENIPTGIQRDHWEYGDMLAAAWDCPMTVQMKLEEINGHPRRHDLLETLRRWEDVRTRNWLTAAQKAEILANPEQERHLYLNEAGEYELLPIEMLQAPEKAKGVRAFLFERNGRRVVACWHMTGSGRLSVALGGAGEVALDDLRYIETDLPKNEVRAAWAKAVER